MTTLKPGTGLGIGAAIKSTTRRSSERARVAAPEPVKKRKSMLRAAEQNYVQVHKED